MKKILLLSILLSIGVYSLFVFNSSDKTIQVSGAPPYGEAESEAPEVDPYEWMKNWVRPDGPTKVALQVGHYKNDELPGELSKLIGNTGAAGGGKTEAEVNLAITEETKKLLEAENVAVEILPATIPPGYFADVFVSVHSDGSEDSTKSGFKFAHSWRDITGRSGTLKKHLEKSYGEYTGLEIDPNITRNMRGYYAFAWWRYKHALHPMTTAVIAETGFLTNPLDRKIIVDQPGVSAKGLAQGIINFLNDEGLEN